MNESLLLGLADITLLTIITILAWPWILKGSDSKLIEPTREFIKKNEGAFSIFFIVLFALEQALLIFLTDYFKNQAGFLRLTISIFALVVITTASLQKFILETKRRYDKETKEQMEKSTKIIEEQLRKSDEVITEYRTLIAQHLEEIKSLEE